MNNINNTRSVEIESAMTDSLSSTPRWERQTTPQRRVRLMCSSGGKILRRPLDNQLRYVGGDTRMVAVDRHTNFTSLLSVLCKLCGTSDINVKYQLPNEDLEALITVSSDEDVENMMEEYDRLIIQNQKYARLRLFLFPKEAASSRATSIPSFLDGSAKREQWFLDALNAGSMTRSGLDRGRSEVSSVISDMPDYLFGLDQSDDPTRETNLKSLKDVADENVSAFDPGSPTPSHMNVLPNLPSIKTKPSNLVPDLRVLEAKESRVEEDVERTEPMILNPSKFTGNPNWRPLDQVVGQMPIYYVPTQMQPVTIRASYVQPIEPPYAQPFPLDPGQVPVGISPSIPTGLRKMYGGLGAAPITRATSDSFGNNPVIYYGVRSAGLIPTYPNAIVSGMEELQASETNSKSGWVSQAP